MNKTILALGITGVLIYSIPVMSAKAFTYENATVCNSEIQLYTEGLIYQYFISASSSNNKLVINGYTRSNESMKSIGIKDIVIQYSSDNKNWSKEKSLNDMLSSDSVNYHLNDYSVSVKGGYYYRISCTHYAKEKGLFGSSQSVENTSNSIWIDNN